MHSLWTSEDRKMKSDDLDGKVKGLTEQGNNFLNEKRFDEAIESFNDAISLDPANSEAHLGRVSCLRVQGKLNEAQHALKDAHEQGLGGRRFRNEEARLYVDQGKYDDAVGIFDLDHKEALVSMIKSLRPEHSTQEVEKTIDAALRLYNDAVIRSKFGWSYYYDGQYAKAVKYFDEALQIDRGCESAVQGIIGSLRLERYYERAKEQVQQAIKRFPNNLGIRSELGWLYFDQKLYEEALKAFKAVEEGGDTNALVWIISCLRSQRNHAEARKWIQKAAGGKRNRIEIITEEGWLHFDQKYYAEAINIFNEALNIDSHHAFALQGKIASLRLQGRFQEAGELIKLALEWHPANIGILCERGWLFFDLAEYYEADEVFERATKVDPNNVDLLFSRVEVLCRINRSYDAEKILLGLKQKFADDIVIAEQLGLFYTRRNNLKSAEEEFQFILGKDANNISGLNGLGTVYLESGRYDEATKTFRKVLQAENFNSGCYVNLAWALVRQEGIVRYGMWPLQRKSQPRRNYFLGGGQANSLPTPLDEADKLCHEALELDPESASAYCCLGTIAFKRGLFSDSEEYLRTSIKKNPREGGLLGLGALYLQMTRYSEAEEKLNEALKTREDILIHLELGNLYLQTERIKEAIQEFNRAMVIDPYEDDPPRALAITYMRINKLNEAEIVLREALRRLDEPKRWRLHITRSQLLMQRGDETHDSQYYDEGHREARKAILLKPNRADPYFQAGLALAKLKDYKAAHKSFRTCLRLDENHFDAEENDRRLHAVLQAEHERSRASFWGGVFVGAIAVVQLTFLWYLFNRGKVSETIVTILVPILLGLVVLAFLYPVLYKLKLPGMEAELNKPSEPVSPGPRGEIIFRSSPPTITSGPR
jgi:tetratricopeptide (TPR) repeat protein